MRRLFLLALTAAVLSGCRRQAKPPGPGPAPRPQVGEPVEAAGLHNVYRLTDKLYSGSSPEGDEGFRSLQRLGVRTVLSVDGARPDVDRARRFGLRYVHLPIGYDGLSREQALRLARAVRDLPGPVYVHCHHGQHRGPAAAAVIHRFLDDRCTVEEALAELRRAGTDPRYRGLYAAPAELRPPAAGELDRVPPDFPEVAEVPPLARAMVSIDERWDNLKLARAAGWKAPPAHPDVDPPHEALLLVELYHEAARSPRSGEDGTLRRGLLEAEEGARRLEEILRAGKKGGAVDAAAAESAFQKMGAACSRCHASHRDVPRRLQ
ncbi:MAG TPA: hypothetical protein VFA26_09260 [Gemmataceae bacterium]|nr:hypothetical protein [Gemmataceae bacterium]